MISESLYINFCIMQYEHINLSKASYLSAGSESPSNYITNKSLIILNSVNIIQDNPFKHSVLVIMIFFK